MAEEPAVAEELLVHATCVALPPNSDQTGSDQANSGQANSGQIRGGILLFGPSGAGKSDLALRLIDLGATLVADDQTRLSRHADQLWAAPPDNLAGRMEVRGLGIVRLPYREPVRVSVCFNLTGAEKIERLPAPKTRTFLGISLPSLDLFPFEASATAKLRLAVRDMSGFIMAQD